MQFGRQRTSLQHWGARLGAIAVVAALAIISLAVDAGAETKKQYWATSLTGSVDGGLLRGLREAVARGDVGWLDVDPEIAVQARAPGINLIFYHVGGNCYIGSDCERFPASRPTGDQWGDTERTIDLNDPRTRKIVVADLLRIVQWADKLAAKGATVGVHLDNVHKLDADGLATIFNEYLEGVETAKQQGLVAKTRKSATSPRTIPTRS